MINWKGFGRKQSWPNVKLLSWHLPGGTEENHNTSVRIAGLWAEISTHVLSNTNQDISVVFGQNIKLRNDSFIEGHL
jgi:hypothetical protein